MQTPAKRRDARDPFDCCRTMLRLVAGHLLDSSTGSDWSAVLALRATCRGARDVVDVRAADLVLGAHDVVADCISDPMPLARVIAGGRRLMRAGLFAPAVLRELAAARDADAQTYRSEATRVERAHALFLQLGRGRTHRPRSQSRRGRSRTAVAVAVAVGIAAAGAEARAPPDTNSPRPPVARTAHAHFQPVADGIRTRNAEAQAQR